MKGRGRIYGTVVVAVVAAEVALALAVVAATSTDWQLPQQVFSRCAFVYAPLLQKPFFTQYEQLQSTSNKFTYTETHFELASVHELPEPEQRPH